MTKSQKIEDREVDMSITEFQCFGVNVRLTKDNYIEIRNGNKSDEGTSYFIPQYKHKEFYQKLGMLIEAAFSKAEAEQGHHYKEAEGDSKMITQIQKQLENGFYETLKKEGFGNEVITKYKHQSTEELADILTEGMMMSWVGEIITSLGQSLRGYELECKGAFREAVLRLLNEATVSAAKKEIAG